MESVSVPGLTPTARHVSRLSARTALYTEVRLLLDGESFPRTPSGYRSIVIEENRLARASTSARTKLWSELRGRYRLDADDPLFMAFWSEWQRCVSEAERGLTVYVLFALNDKLVFDLGTDLLFPLLRRAPVELRVADVLAFIKRAEASHHEVEGWSDNTRRSLAQDYCASIRDFGLSIGGTRKLTVRPALYGAPVRLLVRALLLTGTTPIAIAQHPAFRLLGIDGIEVIDALGELNRTGALRFRLQGDIVELDVMGGR